MAERRVVVATAHALGAPIQVGAHAYAREFHRRGWDVHVLSAPLTPLHLAGIRHDEIRFRWRALRSPLVEERLKHTSPFTLLPLLGPGLRSRRMLRMWPRVTLPSLRRRLAAAMQPDVLVIDTPFHVGLPALLEPKKLVYRVADYMPGFNLRAFEEAERELVAAADIVAYTAPELHSYVKSLDARRAVLVQNGVGLGRFNPSMPEPEDLRRIPHPRVVYVGALREWFDYALVEALCALLPDVHIVVVGPTRHAQFKTRAPNLWVMGSRQHGDVPAYLSWSDVGIIPFDVEHHPDLVNSINPLKLFEYMAAGLPVVSVGWNVLRRMDTPALLATQEPAAFAAAVRTALADQEALAKAGRAFVQRFDWSRQLQPLFDALEACAAPAAETATRDGQ